MGLYLLRIGDTAVAKPFGEAAAGVLMVLDGLGRTSGGLAVEEKGGQGGTKRGTEGSGLQHNVLKRVHKALQSFWNHYP